jgi:glutathione S-transferase
MYSLYNVRRWGSLAPHLVLEELEVPYQNIWMTPESVHQARFRELSPSGLIPVLRLDDGRTVMESAAIVTFLTDANPGAVLAPRPGSADHAVYLGWLSFMSSNLYQAINLTVSPEVFADGEAAQAALKARAIERCHVLFDVIEARLSQEGPWLLGDAFSAGDIYLFMMAIWAEPSEAALHDRCPWIGQVCNGVRDRPRLAAAIEAHGVSKVGGPSVP